MSDADLHDLPPDVSHDQPQPLSRTQRRLLRRIFNGRTVAIVTGGQPFMTYRAAKDHLLSLTIDARETAYAEMAASARTEGVEG